MKRAHWITPLTDLQPYSLRHVMSCHTDLREDDQITQDSKIDLLLNNLINKNLKINGNQTDNKSAI